MIIFPITIDKSLSDENLSFIQSTIQAAYYDEVNRLLKDGLGFSWSIHGYYYRSVVIFGFLIRLRILRISTVNDDGTITTHALLPSYIIPYHSYSLFDMISDLHSNSNNYARYRYSFLDGIDSLVFSFDFFSVFLINHIARNVNLLFFPHTVTN